jgi:hypothetical protein
MAVVVEVDEQSLAAKFDALLPHLNERQQRLALGVEARSLGHGGIVLVALAAGVSRKTVSAGMVDVESGEGPLDRVRRPGGGRKKATTTNPQLVEALDTLVEPGSRGDPMCRLRWTTKSTRTLAEELGEQGHEVSHVTVAQLLTDELDYSLQSNAKTVEGKQHPDRDAQFRYINDQVTEHITQGLPVISVDAKKKELIGNFKNAGQTWCQDADEVNAYDFLTDAEGRAAPYGIYLVHQDRGYVYVGESADTPQFAVDAISSWWKTHGWRLFPNARKIRILADSGGSNGCRPRLWKRQLQEQLADAFGLEVTVCHYPRGGSKWNPIEHRLFSFISINSYGSLMFGGGLGNSWTTFSYRSGGIFKRERSRRCNSVIPDNKTWTWPPTATTLTRTVANAANSNSVLGRAVLRPGCPAYRPRNTASSFRSASRTTHSTKLSTRNATLNKYTSPVIRPSS